MLIWSGSIKTVGYKRKWPERIRATNLFFHLHSKNQRPFMVGHKSKS